MIFKKRSQEYVLLQINGIRIRQTAVPGIHRKSNEYAGMMIPSCMIVNWKPEKIDKLQILNRITLPDDSWKHDSKEAKRFRNMSASKISDAGS